MFENIKDDLLPVNKFIIRLLKYFFIASGFLIVGLIPGIIIFHVYFGLTGSEAFVNALSFLGPLPMPLPITSQDGHIFTAVYGLFIDTIVLCSISTLFAPIVHRVFHRIHLKTE